MQIARAWLLSVGALACAFASACAQGSAVDGIGGAGGTGSSVTTGTKATSSNTNASSSTGLAGSTTNASSTQSSASTGTPCSDSPCKLTNPQCGCPSGKECTVVGTAIACGDAGTEPIGQACGPSADCAPGGACLGAASVSSCLKFCDDDSDCTAPGGVCYFTVSDGMGGAVPGAKLCTENCDPSTNMGCAVTGLGCEAVSDPSEPNFFTLCAEIGKGTQGAACPNGFADCAAKFGCFTVGTSDECLQWCKVAAGVCPGSETCNSLATPLVVGTTEYGVCQ